MKCIIAYASGEVLPGEPSPELIDASEKAVAGVVLAKRVDRRWVPGQPWEDCSTVAVVDQVAITGGADLEFKVVDYRGIDEWYARPHDNLRAMAARGWSIAWVEDHPGRFRCTYRREVKPC